MWRSFHQRFFIWRRGAVTEEPVEVILRQFGEIRGRLIELIWNKKNVFKNQKYSYMKNLLTDMPQITGTQWRLFINILDDKHF